MAVIGSGFSIGPAHPDVWLTPERKTHMVSIAREALRREKAENGPDSESVEDSWMRFKEMRKFARREGFKVGGIVADISSGTVLFRFPVGGRIVAEYRVSSEGEVKWEKTW